MRKRERAIAIEPRRRVGRRPSISDEVEIGFAQRKRERRADRARADDDDVVRHAAGGFDVGDGFRRCRRQVLDAVAVTSTSSSMRMPMFQ